MLFEGILKFKKYLNKKFLDLMLRTSDLLEIIFNDLFTTKNIF